MCAQEKTDEAKEILRDLAERTADNPSTIVAAALAFCGESDMALTLLEQRVDSDQRLDPRIATDPQFENLHDDPRWSSVLTASANLPDPYADIDFEIPLP